MPQINLKIQGDKEVKAALDRHVKKNKRFVVDQLNETMIDTQRYAKELSPVRTGRLRSSIHFAPATMSKMTAIVNVNAHYASYVEFGTTRMKPQPYLIPAWERSRADLIKRLNKRGAK